MGDKLVENNKDMSISSGGEMIGIRGEYQGVRIAIGRSVSIGRNPENSQLVFNNLKVSRQHCTITYEDSTKTYYVLDYSKNGVMRENGTRMPAGELCCFNPGEVIYIGNADTAFRFL